MPAATKFPIWIPGWLKTYKLEFLTCRCFGHDWQFHWARSKVSDDGLETEHRICERCTTERLDVIDTQSMSLWSRKYDYSDGFTLPEDAQWETKAVMITAWQVRSKQKYDYVDVPEKFEKYVQGVVRRREAA